MLTPQTIDAATLAELRQSSEYADFIRENHNFGVNLTNKKVFALMSKGYLWGDFLEAFCVGVNTYNNF